MKRFALTICLAACLVFLIGAVAVAQNTMVIETKNVAMGAATTIGVQINNAVALKNLVIPLTVREIDPGSFITTLTPQRTPGGRLSATLTAINAINVRPTAGTCKNGQPGGFGNPAPFAGVSPVGLLFSCGKIDPGDPNLDPGSDPVAGSLRLSVTVTNAPGKFEVDTTCANPANHLTWVPDVGSAIIPAVTKGVITIIPNSCPVSLVAASPVNVVAGNVANNQVGATDPEGDPLAFYQNSGQGTTNATGLWSYTGACADIPGFDVTVEVGDNQHSQGSCATVTFHVNVSATALAVSNCGDVSVHWGASASKTVGVTGGCPPYSFSVPAGQGIVDQDGNWSFASTCQDLGSHAISITVTDAAQQSANCNFTLNVTNAAPTCTNPADVTAPTGLALSIDMGDLIQSDGDALTYNQCEAASWPSWLSIVDDKIVGARPLGDNTPYSVCFSVSDGCQTSACCCVNILFESPFQICIVDLNPDGTAILPADYAHTYGGMNTTVGIWVNPATGPSGGVGGFEFLVCYDQSLLRFISAARGVDLDPTWEYFTYRTGQFGGNCGGACPNGYVKLVGIADMNNGVTPAPGAFQLAGVIATLTFYVDGNVNYIGLCPHVGFCSFDCTDNSISSRDGYTLYVPTGVGITLGPDYTCDGNNKPGHVVNPFINFCPGAICIDRPPDDRGDINLNGVANEIGDAVLFSRYFISGINVFEANANLRAVQILATDINNDGMTLTVADLVYLIRIITGDAQPFPPQGSGFKLSPYANAVDVNSEVIDGTLNIRTNSTVDLGGALFVYHYSGLTVGEPVLAAGANLQIKSRTSNGELRILVYGNASGARVQSGLNNLVTVPVSGNGSIELAESQVADANGALLTVNAAAKATPSTYALLQNYPNPFNAGTVIQFSLKDASDWNLSIYNIAGQVVRTFEGSGQGNVSVAWNGTAQSGSPVASGMYFYRLSTQDFTATKKMVLMK